MMSALSLASARFSKLWILFLKHLLVGDICTIFFYFHIFFLLVFNHNFSYTLILPVSQLQTQQLMTSQIRPHIKYLIQTYNILVLICYSKLMKILASLTTLKRFNDDSWCGLLLLFGAHPEIIAETACTYMNKIFCWAFNMHTVNTTLYWWPVR